MGLSEQIQKDITEAMKARQEQRLSCLRMVKAALKHREIEKRGPLDDAESQQVLSTLIKQRRDSIEQFGKAGRPELVEKETAEIGVIESYMPRAAGEAEILAAVRTTLAEMGSASGSTPAMKDMGAAMKNVMAKFQAAGTRVEGKTVNEIVKRELARK
ncbi:MAG: GatB/YqeY domain-containing protein [Acidobacteria bacterium]|nr:GatB/YqeY domain-containing protein [Acidobacteriota bacterium]